MNAQDIWPCAWFDNMWSDMLRLGILAKYRERERERERPASINILVGNGRRLYRYRKREKHERKTGVRGQIAIVQAYMVHRFAIFPCTQISQRKESHNRSF